MFHPKEIKNKKSALTQRFSKTHVVAYLLIKHTTQSNARQAVGTLCSFSQGIIMCYYLRQGTWRN